MSSQPISRRTAPGIAAAAGAGAVLGSGARTRPASAANSDYVIRHDVPRQTILGLGVEDAWTYHRIGSDSNDEIGTNYTANAAGR